MVSDKWLYCISIPSFNVEDLQDPAVSLQWSKRDLFLNHLTLLGHIPFLKPLRKLFLHLQRPYLANFGLPLILMCILIKNRSEQRAINYDISLILMNLFSRFIYFIKPKFRKLTFLNKGSWKSYKETYWSWTSLFSDPLPYPHINSL